MRKGGQKFGQAGFEGVDGLEPAGLGVKPELDPGERGVGESIWGKLPGEGGFIGKSLPEVMDEVTFIVDRRIITGIYHFHYSVRIGVSDNKSTDSYWELEHSQWSKV